RPAPDVHHRSPPADRARRRDRLLQLTLGGELDGAVERGGDARAGELAGIRRAMLQHGVAMSVAHRLNLQVLAAQEWIELALETLLTATIVADEAQHVTGELPLRVDPPRLLHQLDAVDGDGADPARGLLVDAPLDPDEAAVARLQLFGDLLPFEVQHA